jgi:hypothetical protein
VPPKLFVKQDKQLGEAVHVDPIKPTLKAPGAQRLKLQDYEVVSSFAFNYNLRRYKLADMVNSLAPTTKTTVMKTR